MLVQVRLFAVARELAGTGQIDVDLPPSATVAMLRQAIAEGVPALAPLLPAFLMAMNSEYVRDDAKVVPGAELAIIPPVSGG